GTGCRGEYRRTEAPHGTPAWNGSPGVESPAPRPRGRATPLGGTLEERLGGRSSRSREARRCSLPRRGGTRRPMVRASVAHAEPGVVPVGTRIRGRFLGTALRRVE